MKEEINQSPRSSAPSIAEVPNRQLVVYALYLLGGDSNPIHTEDIALKCFELFPSSFSWVKYPNYPDKDIVRVALTDARKRSHGALVEGRTGQKRGLSAKTLRNPVEDGWILTPAGVRWTQQHRNTLGRIVGTGEVKSHRQKLLKQLKRLRDHVLFEQYQDNPATFAPSIGVIADLLRCRVDAESEIWEDRFQKIHRQAEAAEQDDVRDFIDRCRQAYVNQQ